MSLVFFLRRNRQTKNKSVAINAAPTIVAAAAIPAVAPVLRPEEFGSVVAGKAGVLFEALFELGDAAVVWSDVAVLKGDGEVFKLDDGLEVVRDVDVELETVVKSSGAGARKVRSVGSAQSTTLEEWQQAQRLVWR
ncbi:MAG: hypothetical protein Q9181_007532, partial [Wetmoreana brouardii]